jgi:mannose-6-phosphate isomerase-like protein (cupin superfamily)
MSDRTAPRFMKFADYRWKGVGDDGYGGSLVPSADEAYKKVERFLLFGPGDDVGFHLRYFEVGPGGYSRLEKHEHAHCVVCLRGKGRLIMGTELYDLNFMDAVYIGSKVSHQLVNTGNEPFGFFCAVDAERDEPEPLEGEELAALLSDPQVGSHIRTGKAFSCDVKP